MLHGSAVINSLTTVRSSEEIAVAGAVIAVGRLISGLKKSGENSHKNQLLLI